MKKIIKKVCLGTLLLASSCVALASCKNKIDLDDGNNATVTESYPYMDKMYRNVYLIGNSTDLKPSLWDNGEEKLDKITNSNSSIAIDKKLRCSGIAVRFKEGTKLRSVTFSIKTSKACYINPYISGYTTKPLSGWDSDPVGKYTYKTGGNWQEENETKSYTLIFGNGEEFTDSRYNITATWVNFDSSTTATQKVVGFGALKQNADFKNIDVTIEISNVSFTFD